MHYAAARPGRSPAAQRAAGGGLPAPRGRAPSPVRTRSALRRAPLGGANTGSLDLTSLAALADAHPDNLEPPRGHLLRVLGGTTPQDEFLNVPEHPPATPWQPSAPCQAIDDALKAGLLRPLTRAERRLLSCGRATLFPVWKRNGTARLICHPVSLNGANRAIPCGLPDVQAELAALFAAGNRVAVTLDGVGFFNQFPLHPDVGALFAAKVGERVLAPTAMPMGVRFAPAVAQRSLALVLRVAGLADVSVVWIDNVLIVAPDDATLKDRLARFHAAATLVGLTYTEDERGQDVDFLGAHLHWGTGLFNFTDRFRDKVAAIDLDDLDLDLDDLQYTAGLANWVCRLARIPLVRVAPLLQALGTASSDPTLVVPVTPAMRLAWQFCQKAVQGSYLLCPRQPPMVSFNLFTDASDLMGGMYVCGNYLPTCMGQWTWEDPGYHINRKELAAVLRALEILDLSDVSLPIGIDSMVVVAILQAGYSRSSDLCGTLEKIVDLCEERDINLLPYWVPTDLNPADYPSRFPLGDDVPVVSLA